jgi:hypothetical protein
MSDKERLHHHATQQTTSKPTPEMFAERDARMAHEPSLEEVLFGSPPPGRSALNKRKAEEPKPQPFRFASWAYEDAEHRCAAAVAVSRKNNALRRSVEAIERKSGKKDEGGFTPVPI